MQAGIQVVILRLLYGLTKDKMLVRFSSTEADSLNID